jgi:hypothetical protein
MFDTRGASSSIQEGIQMKFRSLIALVGLFGVLSAPMVSAQKESKTSTETPTTAKKMPMRDPKTGKFMKASVVKKITVTAKKMPMRDPKTGKFMKATATTMAEHNKMGKEGGTPTMGKKMPMRDPKTGKFIKKSDASNMTAPETATKKK